MIEGLSHITLIVKDIEKASQIITYVLGGQKIYDSGEKSFSIAKERFFDVNGIWLVLMEGEALPSKTYNHIAFKVKEEALPDYTKKIKNLKLEIKPDRPREPEEGQSIYFYDHDNHLFELHTGTLKKRLEFYNE